MNCVFKIFIFITLQNNKIYDLWQYLSLKTLSRTIYDNIYCTYRVYFLVFAVFYILNN